MCTNETRSSVERIITSTIRVTLYNGFTLTMYHIELERVILASLLVELLLTSNSRSTRQASRSGSLSKRPRVRSNVRRILNTFNICLVRVLYVRALNDTDYVRCVIRLIQDRFLLRLFL